MEDSKKQFNSGYSHIMNVSSYEVLLRNSAGCVWCATEGKGKESKQTPELQSTQHTSLNGLFWCSTQNQLVVGEGSLSNKDWKTKASASQWSIIIYRWKGGTHDQKNCILDLFWSYTIWLDSNRPSALALRLSTRCIDTSTTNDSGRSAGLSLCWVYKQQHMCLSENRQTPRFAWEQSKF